MSALGASEIATHVAGLVADRRAFSDEAAEDLTRLLSHSLSSPSTGLQRDGRLGLLLDIVAGSVGEVPTTTTYDAERSARESVGEHWPTSTTLVNAYGHWLSAVRAATRLEAHGSAGRVPSSYRRAGPSYTPAEVRAGLARFRKAFGVWPTEWELREWGQLMRAAAVRSGQRDPRIPSIKPIRRLFGAFPAATRASREHYRDEFPDDSNQDQDAIVVGLRVGDELEAALEEAHRETLS